jgi:RES domain-containing protein
VSLDGFPARTLRADTTLYRIHRADTGAWWFSFDGGGRFDPVGTGAGACYLAEKGLGAWIEVFRKAMAIAEDDVAARALSAVRLGRRLRLADLTSRRALGFGVTASLGADERYGPSQAFAVRALEAGFDGVRYLARHDPAQRLYGVALFGPAGAPAADDALWRAGSEQPIPATLVAQAAKAFGYRVLPRPSFPPS